MTDKVVRVVVTGTNAGAVNAFRGVATESETMAAKVEGHAGRLGSVFGGLASTLGSFGVPLSGSLAKVGDQLGETHSKAKTVGAGLVSLGRDASIGLAGGLAVAGVESVKLAGNFQSAMALIKTQAHDSTDNIATLSKQVLALAGPTATAPTELAAGLYHVTSVGLRGAQAMDTLKIAAEGAKVGHADLESVTTALAGAVSSGIPGVQNMSQAMGALNSIVGAGDMRMSDLNQAMGTGFLAVVRGFGLSLNDAGAALATLGDNNIRGADAATSLRMAVQALAKPLATSSAGTKELAAATKAAESADKAHAAAVQRLSDMRTIDSAKKKLTVADTVHLADAERKVADTAQAAAAAHATLASAQHAGGGSKSLESIGIKAGQLAQDMQTGGLNKALTDLHDHMQAAGITASQSGEFILQAFGKKQSAGLTVLLDNFDKFQSKTEVVRQGASKFGADWQTTTHNLNFQLDQLKSSGEALGVRFGDFLIPKLKETLAFFDRHKKAAEVLAGVIGSVLGVAVLAFAVNTAVKFGRSVADMTTGVVNLGKKILGLGGTGGLDTMGRSAAGDLTGAAGKLDGAKVSLGQAAAGLNEAATNLSAAAEKLSLAGGTAAAELDAGATTAAAELDAAGATVGAEEAAGGRMGGLGGMAGGAKGVLGKATLVGAAGLTAYEVTKSVLGDPKHPTAIGKGVDTAANAVANFFGVGSDSARIAQEKKDATPALTAYIEKIAQGAVAPVKGGYDRNSAKQYLHDLGVKGYDSGGFLMPGLTLALNNSGRPEPIIPMGNPTAAARVMDAAGLSGRAAHGIHIGQIGPFHTDADSQDITRDIGWELRLLMNA